MSKNSSLPEETHGVETRRSGTYSCLNMERAPNAADILSRVQQQTKLNNNGKVIKPSTSKPTTNQGSSTCQQPESVSSGGNSMKRKDFHDGDEKPRNHRDTYNKFTDLELIWLSVFARVRDEQGVLKHFSKDEFFDSFPRDFCARGRTSCSLRHAFSNQVNPNSYPDFYKRKVTPWLNLSQSNRDLNVAFLSACSQPTKMARVKNLNVEEPSSKKAKLAALNPSPEIVAGSPPAITQALTTVNKAADLQLSALNLTVVSSSSTKKPTNPPKEKTPTKPKLSPVKSQPSPGNQATFVKKVASPKNKIRPIAQVNVPDWFNDSFDNFVNETELEKDLEVNSGGVKISPQVYKTAELIKTPQKSGSDGKGKSNIVTSQSVTRTLPVPPVSSKDYISTDYVEPPTLNKHIIDDEHYRLQNFVIPKMSSTDSQMVESNNDISNNTTNKEQAEIEMDLFCKPVSLFEDFNQADEDSFSVFSALVDEMH